MATQWLKTAKLIEWQRDRGSLSLAGFGSRFVCLFILQMSRFTYIGIITAFVARLGPGLL